MKFTNDTTSVVALGGLGEVGKNMYLVCHNDEIIIIDAGVMFPEDSLLGIDYVIQDITFLKQNEKKIKGLIITHGHEDHIGGISFLLQSVNIPRIYTSKIAADLIEKKLVERNINFKNIEIINKDTIIKSKKLRISFALMAHSIPDAFSVIIETPQGIIVESGDFKFDMTPVGPMADLYKLAEAGKKGVKLLMSDSTNALVPGFSKSESIVDTALGDIFAKHLGRIIIATFASNIYRLQHVVETCRKSGRRIVVFGRSMENYINIAIKNNLIADESIFTDIILLII
jgi:ribonuclease J